MSNKVEKFRKKPFLRKFKKKSTKSFICFSLVLEILPKSIALDIFDPFRKQNTLISTTIQLGEKHKIV
jgi:hypothetical protein